MRPYIIIKLLSFFLVILIYCSCKRTSFYSSEDCVNYDYSGCNSTEPLVAGLNIRLTINDENPRVLITIYEGNIENSTVVSRDTISTSKYYIELPPNKFYTVKAQYVSGQKIIYAIGGDNIKKIRNQVCDSVCWSTEDGNVNVELK
ncbi:MAG: hypothetical protein WCQ95_11615 [Bacteroidota bacterium]